MLKFKPLLRLFFFFCHERQNMTLFGDDNLYDENKSSTVYFLKQSAFIYLFIFSFLGGSKEIVLK